MKVGRKSQKISMMKLVPQETQTTIPLFLCILSLQFNLSLSQFMNLRTKPKKKKSVIIPLNELHSK